MKRVVLFFLVLALFFTGCASGKSFDKSLNTQVKPYRFSILGWEIGTFWEGLKEFSFARSQGDTEQVKEYFALSKDIQNLERQLEAVKSDNQKGDTIRLESDLEELQKQQNKLTDAVKKTLQQQIRTVLVEEGIYNPFVNLKVGFPPLAFEIEELPHLLVISPRDRIESMREILLEPGMSEKTMEELEEKIDKLDVSSLVVELGGLGSTFPTLLSDESDLRSIIDGAVEEWLHQYLNFKPLGFRYLLDVTGISRNYEIATMNETVVGMVSKEIGAQVYQKYYAPAEARGVSSQNSVGFDFNREMREIRKAVDNYLAKGETEAAEKFMAEKRQYLAQNGYYIRKLNQAYFAFHGTYAYSPTSVSPIGAELGKLREQCTSLKEFLQKASRLRSRQELQKAITTSPTQVMFSFHFLPPLRQKTIVYPPCSSRSISRDYPQRANIIILAVSGAF